MGLQKDIDIKIRLGNHIRNERIKRNLTQDELADMAGTSQPSISDLERGASSFALDYIQNVLSAMDLKILAYITQKSAKKNELVDKSIKKTPKLGKIAKKRKYYFVIENGTARRISKQESILYDEEDVIYSSTVPSNVDIERYHFNTFQKYIGYHIKVSRESNGWTQTKLAYESGTTQPLISKMEKGTYNFTLDFVEKVFKPLDVNFDFDIKKASLSNIPRQVWANLKNPRKFWHKYHYDNGLLGGGYSVRYDYDDYDYD